MVASEKLHLVNDRRPVVTETQKVSSKPAVKDEILQCLEVVIEVLKFYGFKGECDLGPTAERWRLLSAQCGWMKLVKYKLAAFFSSRNKQPLPPLPNGVTPELFNDSPHMLIGGRAGRFLEVYLKRHDEMGRMSLLFSILQSKKGMPRASKSELKKAEINTALKLGTAPPPVERKFLYKWSERERIPGSIPTSLNQTTIKEQLVRTTREIFRNCGPLTNDERMKVFFPSTSANYINNRARAGAVGFILEHPTLIDNLRRPGGYINIVHPKLHNEKIEITHYPEYQPNTTALEFAFSSLWLNLLEVAKSEKPIAVPIALPEALKNRVITKMPPAQQTVLRCIWKKMHGIVRKQKTFTLIGKMINEEVVNSMLGRLEKDEIFLSGDYEAATDNLYSWVSETIAEEISEQFKLHPIEKQLFIQSLIHHFIEVEVPLKVGDTGIFDYPKGSIKDIDHINETVGLEIEQKNGQLMGSITSFVILCIANAATTRWAHELAYKRRFWLSKLPMLINGDDVALKTTLQGYDYWRIITQSVGLKESVGKTFISRDFVQMNSMNYLYNEEGLRTGVDEQLNVINTPWRYREVKYINFGLVSGQKRSGIVSLNDQDDPTSTIGARYREMLRLAPGEMAEEAHTQFIKYNELMLKRTGLPWYMPEWIGGLGLTGLKDPTILDRRIAVCILQNWKKKKPISLGQSEVAWQTWKVAEKILPKAEETSDSEDPGIEERKQQMGYACVDLLFNSDYSLDDIYIGPKIEAARQRQADAMCSKIHNARFLLKGACKRCTQSAASKKTGAAIFHNQSLWRPRKGILPQPIDLERLPFLRKYETTTVKCETNELQIIDEYFSKTDTTNQVGVPIIAIC
jgi:hypothetical protein